MSKGQKRYDDVIVVPLSSEDKCKIFEIALDEERSMPSVVREFIKKGLSEYERERK